jgi:tetratricopeptide (TPR) repeat protein
MRFLESQVGRSFWSAVGFIVVISVLALHAAQAEDEALGRVQAAVATGDLRNLHPVLPKGGQFPEDITERMVFGHALLAANDLDNALAVFSSLKTDQEKAKYLDDAQTIKDGLPDSSLAWYLVGDALVRDDEPDRAKDAFNTAIKLNTANPLPYIARGTLIAIEGDTDSAVVDLARAVSLDDLRADAWLSQALVSIRSGGLDGAEASLLRSATLDQESGLNHIAAAAIAQENGAWEQASREIALAKGKNSTTDSFADFNAVVLSVFMERASAVRIGSEMPRTSIRASISRSDVQPIIVTSTLPFGSKSTALLGSELPSLGEYYEVPRTPEFRRARVDPVIYDRIVVPFNYARAVDAFNDTVGLLGLKYARPTDPSPLGAIDAAKLENGGSLYTGYENALRLRVAEDHSWALLRFDSEQWKPLSRADAIDYLNAELTYLARLSKQDSSYANVFRALTKHDWQVSFADFNNLKLSQIVSLPPSTTLEVTYKKQTYQLTVSSFLAGNVAKLPLALEAERYQGKQFGRALEPPRISGPVTASPRQTPQPFSPAELPRQPRASGNLPSTKPVGGVSTEQLSFAWTNHGQQHLLVPFPLGYSLRASATETSK